MSCIFCGIAKGEVAAEVVGEGERWIAFRDINPQAPTHVLVVPRDHIESLSELDEARMELCGELLLAAAGIARQEGLAAGYRVVANTGPHGGQTVPHLHVHLLGGRRLGWPPG